MLRDYFGARLSAAERVAEHSGETVHEQAGRSAGRGAEAAPDQGLRDTGPAPAPHDTGPDEAPGPGKSKGQERPDADGFVSL